MALLYRILLADVFFLSAAVWLTVGTLAYRVDRPTFGRWATTYGWGFFLLFWSIETIDYLGASRFFLGFVSLVTAATSFYAAVLTFTDRGPGKRLSAAFATMAVVFVPYQYLRPVFRTVIEVTTSLTVVLLERLGHEPTIFSTSQSSVLIPHRNRNRPPLMA